MSQPTPEWLVISPWAAIAGAFGALISLRSIDDLTPRARVLAVLGGFGCSIYLTPLVGEALYIWSDWHVLLSPRGEAGIAFLLGLTGLSIIGEGMKLLPSLACTFRAWLRRLFGGPQ